MSSVPTKHGLGSYDRDMTQVLRSTAAMHGAHETAKREIAHAKEALAKGPAHNRKAKDHIISARDALRTAAETGRLTASTSGRRIANLPKYHDPEHPHSRAHAANDSHAALVDRTSALRSKLSGATVGDHESVSKAMQGVD